MQNEERRLLDEKIREANMADARVVDERRAQLAEVAKGDEGFREGLRGPIANALDDVAIGLWLTGKSGEAKRVLDVVTALREADEPEASVPEAIDLLSVQITGLVVRQQSRQGAPA